MFKIVASDLDGTLLNPEHTLSPFTREVLQRLHQQGKYFVFATGRHHIDVASIREKVGIPALMITSNGARVHDENDNQIFSKNLDPEIVKTAIDMVKDDETVTIHIYRENDWLLNRVDEDLAKFHQDSGFTFSVFDPENPPLEDVAKVFFIRHDNDYLSEYENRFNATFGERASVAFSTPYCLEIMAEDVSKGGALAAVAKLKNLDLDDCIAFGDGMNDVEMLQAAKKGLIMGNAHHRVKATLPNNEVIGTNEEEAVAHYLENLLLK